MSNKQKTYNDIVDKLNRKYKNIHVLGVEEEEHNEGIYQMKLQMPGEYASQALQTLGSSDGLVPIVEDIRHNKKETASTIYRDALSDSYLKSKNQSPVNFGDPKALFKRSIEYYKQRDIYGSVIDALVNFTIDGFSNDIDDLNIKNFYDNWVADVEFDSILEQILLDFYRVGMVRTYRVFGKYEPAINSVPDPTKRESAAKKKVTTKKGKDLPIKYFLLDPTKITIETIMFSDKEVVILESSAVDNIRELLETPKKELTKSQKELLEELTPDFIRAVKKNEDIIIPNENLGKINYRKQTYETYPVPRGARSFASMEFKEDLRRADCSTLDGITNYILLVKVGSDKFPVKSQDTLDQVAQLFDTPSKSFNVVYTHAIQVEKIISPEVGDILGQDKYKQVNEDITGSWGMIRALIDGVGKYNSEAVKTAVKAVQQEINYGRRKLRRWIEREYRIIAESMGFDRFPVVRFNNMSLKNEMVMMRIIQGLLDRRVVSYETGISWLGLDPSTEIAQMEKELPLVQSGVLGISGSPYQKSGNTSDIQDTQNTPKGTPSEGRPVDGKDNPDRKDIEAEPGEEAKKIENALKKLTEDELEMLLWLLKELNLI